MSNYDADILIQNIKILMKDNDNMTQDQLGEILGMSQSNISKALSTADKKSFTLDQVVGIAKHFNVSVDWLVGNRAAENKKISERSVAELLSKLIEHHDMKYKKFTKEEEVYTPFPIYEYPYMDYEKKKIENEYYALFIPGYWEVPKPCEDPDIMGDIQCAQQAGNDTRLNAVNDFLKKFIQIYEVYSQKGLDEEAYRTVVDNYLSRLRDK